MRVDSSWEQRVFFSPAYVNFNLMEAQRVRSNSVGATFIGRKGERAVERVLFCGPTGGLVSQTEVWSSPIRRLHLIRRCLTYGFIVREVETVHIIHSSLLSYYKTIQSSRNPYPRENITEANCQSPIQCYTKCSSPIPIHPLHCYPITVSNIPIFIPTLELH